MEGLDRGEDLPAIGLPKRRWRTGKAYQIYRLDAHWGGGNPGEAPINGGEGTEADVWTLAHEKAGSIDPAYSRKNKENGRRWARTNDLGYVTAAL